MSNNETGKATVLFSKRVGKWSELSENSVFVYRDRCDDLYCMRCRKKLKQKRVIVNTKMLPSASELKYVYFNTENMDEVGVDMYGPCECGTKVAEIRQKGIDELAGFYPEFKGYKEAKPFYGLLKETIGVSYNEDRGVLSLFHLGKTTFRPLHCHDVVMLKDYISRLSVNVNTGRAYVYNSCEKAEKRFYCCNWTDCIYGSFDNDDETLIFFAKELVRRIKLPLSLHTAQAPSYYTYSGREIKQTEYHIKCGNTEISYTSCNRFIAALIQIISAPNVFVETDTYRGESSFRKATTKALREIATYTREPQNMVHTGNIFTPVGRNFRKMNPKMVVDDGEYITSMCEKLRIPSSRKFKKLFRENPLMMGYVEYCKENGIKENDNLWKMVSLLEHTDFFYTKQEGKEVVKPFIKAMIKASGETTAVNRLLELIKRSTYAGDNMLDVNMLYDTAIMYSDCKEEISLKASVKDIHDRLSILQKTKKKENQVIEPTSTEKKRVASYDGFSFCLAEDLYRMVDIGVKMHICVGSGGYDKPVLKHKSTIYYVVDKDGRYAACIELQKNKLTQAKGYCNQILEGEVAKALFEWVSNKKVAHQCYDYYEAERLFANSKEELQAA